MAIRRVLLAAAAALLLAAPATAQEPRGTLRAVLNGELRSLDPVWTTATQTRYHAFMVYDTLFGLDSELRVQPQMVERYEVSPDNLIYTFTLRDGLRFHDGAAVTAEDVVASWRRWALTDAAGQSINGFLSALEAVDARTFRATLKEPMGQLLFALAKPMAMPMFIMPARLIRDLTGQQQVPDATGSGPFRLLRDQWVPGSRVTYARNPDYVPRAEPASGNAGGKRVRVERVEWLTLPDPATQAAALQRNEIDFVETAPLDLVPLLRRAPGVVVRPVWPTGTQGILRLNHLNPPFDNPAIRRAIQHLVLQPDMIQAVLGDPAQGQICGALLICGSPSGSEHGAEALTSRDPAEVRIRRGREALQAAGYRGEPIIVLQPTDQVPGTAATLVFADALRRAGMNVDVQAMDWATLVTRRASREPGARGWHTFMTTGGPMGPSNAAFHIPMSAACDRAWFGWPCDEQLERLRAAWVRETDPTRARALAEDIQRRGMEITVYLPFGQFILPAAWRDSLDGLLSVPETVVFWNVAKRG
ncbi:ABC transporter substrate-binding protein [Muricoccus radiodurans]|uniref:ABC transporter substrate-binding protein n=1 Tax=Muricoccus radiodurans TaxID=2231721 RepID=UPI003CE982D4